VWFFGDGFLGGCMGYVPECLNPATLTKTLTFGLLKWKLENWLL